MKKMFINPSAWALLIVVFFGINLQIYADTEPNNDIASANPLALNTLQTGDLFVNPANDINDYYVVTLPGNGLVSVTGNFDAGLSGYIYIHSASGSQLTYSQSGT